MANVQNRADAPEPKNVVTEYRDMGDGTKAKVIAAVTLWPLGGAANISCASDTVAATAVELPTNDGAISILASGGRMFFALGDEDVEATANDHCVNGAVSERIEFLLKTGETHISILCDDGVEAARLDISGLGA